MKSFVKSCPILVVLFASVPGAAVAQTGEPSRSRAPASVVAPVEAQPSDLLRNFRVPTLSAPKQSMRWRLMGTCRQDIGMSQSVSGFGYGNCNN